MYVIACSFQVKEGTENRGSIESVVRVVRKTVRRIFLLLLGTPNPRRSC